MYERISSFLPRPIIDELRRQFIYNHIYIDERKFAGFMVLFTLLLSAGVSVICQYAFGLNILLTFIASAIGLFATAYLLLRMSSESKGKFVDTILPDALQLIASNMRSGLTTERSLFVAGRPEFGPLEAELKATGRRIMAGIPLQARGSLQGSARMLPCTALPLPSIPLSLQRPCGSSRAG